MRTRIVGIENEYLTTSKHLRTNETDHEKVVSQYRPSFRDQFTTTNGGRFYVDINSHIEYATPELRSSNLRAVVAYMRAGDRMLLQQNPKLARKHRLQFYSISVASNRNFSCGRHRNFLVDAALMEEKSEKREIERTLPYFTTELLLTGSGDLYTENEKLRFGISQRAPYIESEMNSSTQTNRPIINIKDESLCEEGAEKKDEPYKRLHLIQADHTMSYYQNRWAVGIPCIILDLAELGKLPNIQLSDAVKTLHAMSARPYGPWYVETSSGKKSAVDIQRMYLKAAQEFVDKDPQTKELLYEWEQVLDQLERRDWDPLSRRLDWIQKRLHAERRSFVSKKGKKRELSPVEKIKVASTYHNIDPRISLYYRLVREAKMDDPLSEDEINYALSGPPTDTRAFARVLVSAHPHLTRLNWNTFALKDSESSRERSFTMPDPFDDYENLVFDVLYGSN